MKKIFLLAVGALAILILANNSNSSNVVVGGVTGEPTIEIQISPTDIPTEIPTYTPEPTIYVPPVINTCSGATAICNDGTCSYSAHRQGTCSHHGGVTEWL